MTYISISQIFRECVEAASIKLLPQLKDQNDTITGVHFRHGHHLEIKVKLMELGDGVTTPMDIWPMVALFRDFTETKGKQGIYSTPSVTLVIATINDEPNMSSDEREQRKFIPILQPIYEELLNQIWLHPRVNVLSASIIPHTKIDHYYYGSSVGQDENPGKNIFNEWTDSIEIRGLEVAIKEQNC